MMQHYFRYLVRLIPTLKPWSHWYLPVIYSYGLYFTKHCKLSNQIQSYPCRQIIMYLSFQFPLNLIILFFFILKLDLHDVIQILLVYVVMAGFFWRGGGGGGGKIAAVYPIVIILYFWRFWNHQLLWMALI